MPDDINSIPVDDIYKYVVDPPEYKGPSPKIRLNFVKMLYDVLDLQLTSDAALCSISMNQSLLALATAGSGKTTLMQTKAILYKLILDSRMRKNSKMLGKEILCLVYNHHNVADIQSKHYQMVTKLRMANINGFDVDDEVSVKTMHSFCDGWSKQYVAKMGLVGFELLKEEQSLNVMRRAINITYKKLKIQPIPSVTDKNMLSFYTLCKETCKTPDELQNSDKFKDLKAPLDLIKTCFERYEIAKASKRGYDFCDMLVKFYELISTDPKALATIQKSYSVIIADEVQDFTPIMWKILKLLVSDNTILNCIGDEDQSIYYFRGADIHALLDFRDDFENAKVYTLVHNRRCCGAILKEAKRVIEKNNLRFDKDLVGSKSGGLVELIPYSTVEGQLQNVTEEMKKKTRNERYDTVICFRERSGSMLLADLLEENDVPFNSLQGALPMQHE